MFYKLEKLLDYIRFRTYDRYDRIKLNSLEPSYYDVDTRLLHGMFNLLVDFVEIEKANMEIIFGEDDLYSRPTFHKWYSRIYRRIKKLFSTQRFPEKGLAYLDWEINNTDKDFPESQREYAKEEKELYLWWKNSFLTREDEMDIVGLTDFWLKMDEKYKHFKSDLSGDFKMLGHRTFRYFVKSEDGWGWIMESLLSDEEREKEKKLYEQVWKLEQDRYDEETNMLIRLIKIRNGLWT